MTPAGHGDVPYGEDHGLRNFGSLAGGFGGGTSRLLLLWRCYMSRFQKIEFNLLLYFR